MSISVVVKRYINQKLKEETSDADISTQEAFESLMQKYLGTTDCYTLFSFNGKNLRNIYLEKTD